MGLAAPPIRPPAITPFNTYVYKHVNSNDLKVDVYLPSNPGAGPLPVALYIPGGGWMGVDRDDYSRPLFDELLSKGFLVCCMDYRPVPETSFTEVTEDVKRIETWIRQDLPVEIGIAGVKVDCNKLVVVGASAGGHLALLTV
jgi:acetyl esterase/lipase